jgi:hypothetical protein
MNEDLISVAEKLESRFATRKLYETLSSAGLITERPAGALGGIEDALAKSPRHLVQDFPHTDAYRRLLDQLDAQIRHTRLVGRVLLMLFCVLVVITISLAGWALAQREAPKDIKTWLSAASSIGIGAWNQENQKESARLFRDYQRLVKAMK